jgi:hypothetical protein
LLVENRAKNISHPVHHHKMEVCKYERVAKYFLWHCIDYMVRFDEQVTGGVWGVFDCVLLATSIVLWAIANTNLTKVSRGASMLQLPPTISSDIIGILKT